DPAVGLGPLTVIFDMCKSSDPDGDPLTFFFNFGDGSKTSGSSCIENHTYAAALRAAGDVRAQDVSYLFEGSAVDPSLASSSRSRTVTVQTPTPTPPACGTPSASVSNATCQTTNTLRVTVTASDPSGISSVIVKGVHTGDWNGSSCTPVPPVVEDTQTATGSAPTFTATLTLTRTFPI